MNKWLEEVFYSVSHRETSRTTYELPTACYWFLQMTVIYLEVISMAILFPCSYKILKTGIPY